VTWCLVLSIVYVRSISRDLGGMVMVARRGRVEESGDAETTPTATHQLSRALDERNRQVAALAVEINTAPITGAPRDVAAHLVGAARRLMGDPTWALAIVRSNHPELLPSGAYRTEDPRTIDNVSEAELWATTVGARGTERAARVILGPWGAFLIVEVAKREDVAAVLIAPWEGRAEPSAAELDLLSLLGQHAGTALEHAVLYSTVRQQAESLDQMAQVQSDFLRGVSHDLQTPLTSIRALATELQALPNLGRLAREDLDVIGHQADRLSRMVAQLLVVSRLEAGVLTPRQEVFAVRPLVERTWRALRADRPFSIHTSGDAQLAVADVDRLEQVLWALLDNAAKYSPPDGPIAITIGPTDATTLEIRISDKGTGMDAATLARAFEQFYRADLARRLVPDGSGVGLYAARGLVEAMGGRIALTSSLGRGTTVAISLPAERAEAEVGESASASE